jgi:purine-cytosine permease-like protein
MPPTVSKTKVFIYAYLGFFIPLVLLEILGAAFITTSFVVPEWANGYAANGAGGLLAASLKPVGRFGKFCMVVLSLSEYDFDTLLG